MLIIGIGGEAMARDPQGRIQARREEIIAACRQLYKTMSFQEITIKEIGKVTPFTRTSIYNYFETKEEILLALLQEEYEALTQDLQTLCPEGRTTDAEGLACTLAQSLERRPVLLRLLSMNLYDMEGNSRLERLVEFKRAYFASVQALEGCLCRVRPALDEAARERFLYVFLPFIYGLYPYTSATEKQIEAMKEAGAVFEGKGVYEMTYLCVRQLLGQ